MSSVTNSDVSPVRLLGYCQNAQRLGVSQVAAREIARGAGVQLSRKRFSNFWRAAHAAELVLVWPRRLRQWW